MTITNFQIIDICKRYNIPLNGVYNKDCLPLKRNRQPGSYVINLQDDEDSSGNNLGGSHWIIFYIEKDNCVYFDGYGIIFLSKMTYQIYNSAPELSVMLSILQSEPLQQLMVLQPWEVVSWSYEQNVKPMP